MTTTYHLKASELNHDFLEQIKEIFGDREIEITISEVDETEYLFRSTVNKNRLLKSVENIKNREDLVEISLQDL